MTCEGREGARAAVAHIVQSWAEGAGSKWEVSGQEDADEGRRASDSGRARTKP